MTSVVASVVLAVIVVLALRYLYKAKKNGATCVGCPNGRCCSQGHSGAANVNCVCSCTHTNGQDETTACEALR